MYDSLVLSADYKQQPKAFSVKSRLCAEEWTKRPTELKNGGRKYCKFHSLLKMTNIDFIFSILFITSQSLLCQKTAQLLTLIPRKYSLQELSDLLRCVAAQTRRILLFASDETKWNELPNKKQPTKFGSITINIDNIVMQNEFFDWISASFEEVKQRRRRMLLLLALKTFSSTSKRLWLVFLSFTTTLAGRATDEEWIEMAEEKWETIRCEVLKFASSSLHFILFVSFISFRSSSSSLKLSTLSRYKNWIDKTSERQHKKTWAKITRKQSHNCEFAKDERGRRDEQKNRKNFPSTDLVNWVDSIFMLTICARLVLSSHCSSVVSTNVKTNTINFHFSTSSSILSRWLNVLCIEIAKRLFSYLCFFTISFAFACFAFAISQLVHCCFFSSTLRIGKLQQRRSFDIWTNKHQKKWERKWYL